jgi:hypothetical protein
MNEKAEVNPLSMALMCPLVFDREANDANTLNSVPLAASPALHASLYLPASVQTNLSGKLVNHTCIRYAWLLYYCQSRLTTVQLPALPGICSSGAA